MKEKKIVYSFKIEVNNQSSTIRGSNLTFSDRKQGAFGYMDCRDSCICALRPGSGTVITLDVCKTKALQQEVLLYS